MKITSLILATTALTLGAGLAQAQEMADSMTIVSWGGAYQDSQLKAYVQPYQKATGISVTWDESSNDAVAKLRAQAEAGNITWDLVDVTAADALRLCDEGLARPMNFNEELAPGSDGATPEADFGNVLVNDCFIPQIVYSITWGYRNDVADWNGAVPTSLCDVFDTAKFPGKRSIESRPINNMEWALACDGVPNDKIYSVLATPEGQQQALDKWSTIKGDLIFWNAGADTPQFLANGDAVMGSTYNGRLFNAIEVDKQPISMLWDKEIYDYDGWIIPEGLPADRLARVLDFVKINTDTQHLADQALYISYSPARASSLPLVGKDITGQIDMLANMPTNPKNAIDPIEPDFLFWADNRDDIDQKWQAWMAQ